MLRGEYQSKRQLDTLTKVMQEVEHYDTYFKDFNFFTERGKIYETVLPKKPFFYEETMEKLLSNPQKYIDDTIKDFKWRINRKLSDMNEIKT